MKSYPLDHLVLPTRDLATAEQRLTALGFTVAPKGVHPFGTENCCIYLADGTFLEPLAVGDPDAADEAVRAGNQFVARDRDYRARLGEDGFSALVFGTGDADADHARYMAGGISAGGRLDFSRPFIDAMGKSDVASFRLAFARGRDWTDAFLFACERVNAPRVDRAALQTHKNGALAIDEVIAVSNDPGAQMQPLAIVANAASAASSGGELVLPNALVSVQDPAAFEARFAVPAVADSPFRLAAVVFDVADLGEAENILVNNAVLHHLRGDVLVVPAAPGQGAHFVFREKT